MNEATRKTHWSFWLIGIVALLWNMGTTLNFFMQTNADSVAQMPDYVRAVVENRPVWATAAFAIAGIAGVIGAILLLMRKPAAVPLFIISFVGVVIQLVPLIGLDNVNSSIWLGTGMSIVFAAFLIWYSKRVLGTK